MFSKFWRNDGNDADRTQSELTDCPDDAVHQTEELSASATHPADQEDVGVAQGVGEDPALETGPLQESLVSEQTEPDELDEVAGQSLPIASEPPEEDSADSPAANTSDSPPQTKLPAADRKRGRRLEKPSESGKPVVSPEQRLLLLDTWRRSGLPAKDFAALVGVSKHTLYKWKQLFEQYGPEGLMNQPRNRQRGSQLPELTKRAILMMKEAHPDWGCERISDMLQRGPALPASASSVAKVLKEAGYHSVVEPVRMHPQKARRFERARPNQLWQTDLFTFMLKRQNRRLYLIAFLDDHSRFITSIGLSASATTAHVIEALEAGIAAHGPPEEVLTDNGPQYVTWRGTSRFTQHLKKRGIVQLVAKPKRPQTLGKVERFWGTLWREFLESAIFTDLEDARRRVGLFVDYYNFSRVHRGIDGLVPADRFYSAAPEVLQTLKERVQANALDLARHGSAKQPFYVTGNVDGQAFSVHSEGDRLILRRDGEEREEVELTGKENRQVDEQALPTPLCADGSLGSPAGEPAEQPPNPPGVSAIGLDAKPASSEPAGEQPEVDHDQ